MTKNLILAALLFSVSFAFTSCEKDDPEPPNEEELITTLTYTLTPDSGGDVVTLQFKDLDGDGGDAPTITEGTLQANTTYSGVIELLNETETPAENITDEVREEDEEHQFFFSSTISDLTVTYSDTDSDNNPIGINSSLQTGAAGSGELTVVLRHEPSKSAEGVSDGDITNAGGETDIEVTFTINVQ